MGPGSAIVNIASVEALRPGRGHAHYAAAKAALVHYTKSQALELAGRGIRANAVCPGLLSRPGLEAAWPAGLGAWKRASPSNRPGLPGEVAAACLFLASAGASWINGASLVVDGGGKLCGPSGPGSLPLGPGEANDQLRQAGIEPQELGPAGQAELAGHKGRGHRGSQEGPLPSL